MTHRVVNIFLSVGMFVLCAVFLYQTNKLSYPSNVFPYILIIGIAILSLMVFLQNIFSKAEVIEKLEKINYKRVISIVAISFLYISSISAIGFYAVTSIYLMVMCVSLQSHETSIRMAMKIRNSFILTIIVVIIVYIVFNILLKVPTPRGFLI
ncbi:MAG: hypothetical protein VR72_20555 [Clostridiaceae bacterium BRH_c20a]|nr:MAG: hypothetical protein VR72_20555 [Clostridiaceae bacterium BRH_c20a]